MNINRRDFLTACGAFAATTALAKPIRSMLASTGTSSVENDAAPLPAPYITDGLVALWDGEFNALDGDGGFCHDPVSDVWVDWTGNHDIYLTDDAVEWGNNYLKIPSGSNVVGEGESNLVCKTLEVVGTFGNSQVNDFILDLGNNTSGLFSQWNHIYNAEVRRAKIMIEDGLKGILGTNSCAYSDNILNSVLYRNGVRSSLENRITNSRTSTSGHLVLRRNTGGWVPRNIRVYDRCLTPAEIAYNYSIDQMRFGL